MIINKTKGTTISQKEMICRTVFSQARGLMFRPKQNLVMVFPRERRISLHMFFVFYPIDVLIVNAKMKVVEIKKNFKPFTFWTPQKEGRYVVELARCGEYEIGDLISLKNHKDEK